MVYCNRAVYKLTEVNMNGKLSTALLTAEEKVKVLKVLQK